MSEISPDRPAEEPGRELERLLDSKLRPAAQSDEVAALTPDGFAPTLPLRDAAVLIPIIRRPAGAHVLLTRRPETLAHHPGQVAFPGGRIDPGDKDPVAAALREAQEEVGLSPGHVDVRGTLEPMATGTGFRIFPVVGLVDPAFVPKLNSREVAEAFEVPFVYLMNPEHHQQKSGVFRGIERRYHELLYESHRIWGVTAHIIVSLYRRLYG